MIENLKRLHNKYHRYIPAVFFLLGFIFDLITLGRIDDILGIVIQALYLLILFLLLGFKIKQDQHPTLGKLTSLIVEYFDDLFHFLTGSLLSAFTIFYFKSTSISNSLIFMLIMSGILIYNETQSLQKRSIFKSLLVFLCLLSFLTYTIPIILGMVGTFVFILSLIIYAAFVYAFIYWTKKQSANLELQTKTLTVFSSTIGITFLLLYILKMIPPVPLSIQHIGIYNDLKKKENSYELTYEKSSLKFWKESSDNFNYKPNDKIYIFTSVFSPRGFKDQIYLKWQRKNNNGVYVTSDRIKLNISGGRDLGFRGYAYKKNYSEGLWRVLVETSDESEIGRIEFIIEEDKSNEKREMATVIM